MFQSSTEATAVRADEEGGRGSERCREKNNGSRRHTGAARLRRVLWMRWKASGGL